MTSQYFLKKIRDVKGKDVLSFGKLLIAFLIKPFYLHKYKHCWVVCETENEARDNGYHFFKYLRNNRTDINCYYAINKKSPDALKIRDFGNIIQYGSLKHWVLYLCADYNISSQKGGKPNAAICAFLELMHIINSRFVFLQHGVTINNCSWAHADTTQLEYLVTSTIPETQYIKDTFGFEARKIVMTGMPRFDNLHDNNIEQNYILIMPTWRSRFALNSEHQESDNDFTSSFYKKSWETLLNHSRLSDVIDKYNLKVVFFPHRHMQQFLREFKVGNNIIVADWRKYDIQEEMKKAAMMITDYSSVFFDMVYMKKPVIFYQFDYEDFRRYDYKEGYFDYKDNPFGKWCEDSDQVIDELILLLFKNIKVNESFLLEHSKIFPYYDRRNSERLADLLAKK